MMSSSKRSCSRSEPLAPSKEHVYLMTGRTTHTSVERIANVYVLYLENRKRLVT